MHSVRFFAVAAFSLAAATPALADIVANRSGQTIALPDGLGSGVNVLAGTRRSDDCDDIRVITSPQRGSLTAISLRTAPGMWGKTVELFVDDRRRGTLVAPGGGRAPSTVPVPPGELHKAQLHFVKPKVLGVPTGVYQIVGLGRFAGQDIDIFWARDRC